MALTYDIKKDVRYQQGKEEGKQEGKEEKEEEIILALLKSGLLTDEQIAQTTGASLKQIQRIKASIKN